MDALFGRLRHHSEVADGELLDPSGLARLAQFNDNYLHVDRQPRLPAEAAG